MQEFSKFQQVTVNKDGTLNIGDTLDTIQDYLLDPDVSVDYKHELIDAIFLIKERNLSADDFNYVEDILVRVFSPVKLYSHKQLIKKSIGLQNTINQYEQYHRVV